MPITDYTYNPRSGESIYTITAESAPEEEFSLSVQPEGKDRNRLTRTRAAR